MITFDAINKRIILDSTSITAEEIFSRWEDWALLSDNAKYGAVMTHVGGDDLGGGLFIPNYIFLQNGWRVRPMESSHNLTITGNLFVEGGARTAAAFLQAGLVDRILLYRAPIVIGGGMPGIADIGLSTLSAAHGQWQLEERRLLGSDTLDVYSREPCSPV